MNPAPSVILFTVFSGMGFGALAFLGLGLAQPAGGSALALWGLANALAVGGLMASAFHLGNPQRALLAFTQWRSSWLSREAWAAVAALVALAPAALSDWLGLGWPRWVGFPGAVLCVAVVGCTAMIYAQIRAVPRWHNATVPVLYLVMSGASGAVLLGLTVPASILLVLAGAAMLAHWAVGDQAFVRAGSTMGSATGLGSLGGVQVFEPAHTAGNYLLREMIFVVGRRHAVKLRGLALGFGVALPVLTLWLLPGVAGVIIAIVLHLLGAFAQRWLFFAEAEHVVGLYYGKR
ncbi:MAG: dimethyl sulfoxide reductase anchor subunit family protein [Paracoccaceae bacterium]